MNHHLVRAAAQAPDHLPIPKPELPQGVRGTSGLQGHALCADHVCVAAASARLNKVQFKGPVAAVNVARNYLAFPEVSLGGINLRVRRAE